MLFLSLENALNRINVKLKIAIMHMQTPPFNVLHHKLMSCTTVAIKPAKVCSVWCSYLCKEQTNSETIILTKQHFDRVN